MSPYPANRFKEKQRAGNFTTQILLPALLLQILKRIRKLIIIQQRAGGSTTQILPPALLLILSAPEQKLYFQ